MFGSQLVLTANELNREHYMEQSIITRSVEDAEDSFVDAKERMLDVNHWNRYCNQQGVFFSLTDSHSRLVSRRAHKGDHIKINAPEMAESCVVIDAIEYDDYPDLDMETFTMRLHPCAHNDEEDEEGPCNGVLASLIIERKHKNVFAVFSYRNSAGEPVNATQGCFGLADEEWNSMLKRFVV
ncbi:MAG: hypothetical protein K0Q79_1191 [Flavipsychrobacter sp.]|nr:hypothetical protein [Flavipsychrobacter sp.]